MPDPETPIVKPTLLQRLPTAVGGEFDVEGVTGAGISAGVVNVLTESTYPLVTTVWGHCPVRIVAFGICALMTTRGSYEGNRMRKFTSWLIVTLCLYAAALGINKVSSEVKSDLTDTAGAIERPQQQQPTEDPPPPKPRRPGDPW